MCSSSRQRGFSVSIKIILIYGYAVYFSGAMIPLSIHLERQHTFLKSSEFLGPNYQAESHLRTGIREDAGGYPRQKTALAITSQKNFNISCDSGRIMSLIKNGTLALPQKSRCPFEIMVNSTQISPEDIVNVTIKSTGKEAFRGFFLQMLPLLSSTGNGAMFPQSRFLPGEQIYVTSCVNAGDSVVHADELRKKTVSFLWKAPSIISGPFKIRGSIVQDKGIYWDNVSSQPINAIIEPYKEEKPKITTPATQVGIFNSSRAEAISPKSVTSNQINTNTPILKHVYKRETIFNTALNATASLEKKPLFSQEPRVSQRNRIQSEKSKQDELSKSVTFNSLASFDDLLSGEGIRRIEGVDFKAVDHTLYQDFPTVNSSQMTDSFGSHGNLVAPPETSEFLATAMKSIIGGGGRLGTMINTITTINRLRSLIGKRKSHQASNMNGFSGMMGGGFPMGGLGGLGAQPQINLQSLQQQVQALQQQVALQTSQLALQNQLGLQSPLAGLQNPYGLQNSQPQLGLGMQGYNQFGTGGFPLDYLSQNQFSQFMPSLGGNPFDGSSGTGGMSSLGAGSSFGQNSGGALGGSSSGMFGGQPNSFMLGGGVNTGTGTSLLG